ncbi:MAG TPA: DUF5398 family protein [Chlamydiales bacterium]|jgi:hypothetical protein|nr:DUF5398 family protein [Chlamydiales bacterium]
MYGLKKEPKGKFAFDLEKEVKEKPTHGTKILEKAEQRILEIKKQLREGVESKDFDQLGLLLHGYAALQKVLKKVMK